ncbi:MAG: putative XRE-type DNA-binding protein [Vicingaceae bacterium]|jgi:predicted XRE-type DNA-binding protein
MTNREIIVSEPAYWVEDLNGKIYDAIVRFMEARNFKQKDMAKHLDISAGRLSQILNSGDINFSYSKIVSILLKLDLIPHFDLENKADFIKKELEDYAYQSGILHGEVERNQNPKWGFNRRKSTLANKEMKAGKVIPLENVTNHQEPLKGIA